MNKSDVQRHCLNSWLSGEVDLSRLTQAQVVETLHRETGIAPAAWHAMPDTMTVQPVETDDYDPHGYPDDLVAPGPAVIPHTDGYLYVCVSGGPGWLTHYRFVINHP